MSTVDGVFLTGASGLVGSRVCGALTAQGREVYALTHRRRLDHVGVTSLPGNIRQPLCGLADVERMRGRVSTVIHSAATTDFGLPVTEYDELNVNGTRHALQIARMLDADFLYVGTAYVCGERSGLAREDELDVGQGFGNHYERSKFDAEQLVRASGLRYTIVRPGIVTGDYATGAIAEYKNLYIVVKLIVEGKLARLPGRYDATLGVVPADHVSQVITRVATVLRETPERVLGKAFHAVGRHSISLRQVSDVLAEYPCFRSADFVPHASFDPAELEPVERAYFTKVGSLYTTYFSRQLEFDSPHADDLLGAPAPDTGVEYLRRLLDYCLDTGYLGAVPPSITDILAKVGAQ